MSYSFSCVLASLPEELARLVRAAGALIPASDLAPDGREQDPHCTVRYGLHTQDAVDVAPLVAGYGPLRARLGPVVVFDGSPEYDVVVQSVDSPDLQALHAALGAAEHTDTYPEYRPHVTVAYVTKGLGASYAQLCPLGTLAGSEIDLPAVHFADKEGTCTPLSLEVPARADPEADVFAERHALDPAGHWVTIDGAHVYVDGEGNVQAGPARLTGRPLADLTTPAEHTVVHHAPGHDPRTAHRTPATTEQIAAAKDRGVLVPPKSWDVQVAPDPEAKVQVTWMDASGKKQYGYHPRAVAERDSHKFAAVHTFAQALPALRHQVQEDLRRPDAQKEKVAAAVVTLLDKAVMRVGSEEFATEHDTYGASSLRKDHVRVSGTTVHAEFRGKHGVAHTKDVQDAALADAVRHLLTLPGDRVFQYHTPSGGLVPLTEDKVNDYLRSFGATAKQFRTYHASRLAAEYLAELGAPSSEKAAEKNIADAVARTARVLGNTPAVCRGSYINPAILDAYRKGVTMTHPHHQEMGVPA